MEDAGRPQDQGRRHRRRADPSPATASLLAEYQASMRDELRSLLTELRGKAAPPGLLGAEIGPVIERPSLKERAALWDLAIRLGRELGAEVDTTPAKPDTTPPRPRRGKVDFG